MRITPSLLLFVGTLAASCGSAGTSSADVPPRYDSGTLPDSNGGFAPDVDWKSERKRLAMLGLAYDSGRAVVVPSEAASVLHGIESPADAQWIGQLVRDGDLAYAENRALEAIALFTKVVLLEPTVAEHYAALGRALFAFKLESQAIAAWETGHELDSEQSQLNFHVADMAYRQGDRARARALFERAVELDPKHAASWGRLARLSYFDGSDEQAWGEIHRAEELGESIPAFLRAQLAARCPEPVH